MLPSTERSESENSEGLTPQPMGFTDILDATFSLYRSHLRTFLGVAVIFPFAELCLQLSMDFPQLVPQVFLRIVITITSSLVLTIVGTGGIVMVTAMCYLEKQTTSRDALHRVLQQFFPLIGCTLLWTLTVAVLAVPLVGIPFAIYFAVGIPFAIYFAVRWGFFVETVLLERKPVRAALRRSGELVQDMWWRVCGMFLAFFLLSSAIHTVLEVSLGFIFVLSGVVDGVDLVDILRWAISGDSVFGPDDLVLYTITTGIHLLLSVFTFPIWIIGITLLYFNQRIRKEGFDLEMRANILQNVDTEHKM